MIQELNDNKINIVKNNKNNKKRILYFYSTFNPKSLLINEDLEEISKIYEDRDNIEFFKINSTFNPKINKLFHIENIPFILFIDEKNEIINFLEKEIDVDNLLEQFKIYFPIKSTLKEIFLDIFKNKKVFKNEQN